MSDQTWPEHTKLAKVHQQSQAIGEFVDWMAAKGYSFMKWGDYDRLSPTQLHQPIEALLAEFYEIDTEKLEEEKREMLEILREKGSPL